MWGLTGTLGRVRLARASLPLLAPSAQELQENETRYNSMATAMGRFNDSLRSIEMIANSKNGACLLLLRAAREPWWLTPWRCRARAPHPQARSFSCP